MYSMMHALSARRVVRCVALVGEGRAVVQHARINVMGKGACCIHLPSCDFLRVTYLQVPWMMVMVMVTMGVTSYRVGT